MTNKRQDDKTSKSQFRSNRLVEQDGKWFFLTREGGMEGPFGDVQEAERRLENYIRVMKSGMLTPATDLDLDVIPND